MAKVNQKGGKQWESPQMVPQQMGTKAYGGAAPGKHDIIKSANARGSKRHDMKGEVVADVGVLADSARIVGNEMVGIRDDGYLVKKNLEYGPNALYNSLPPGMDIEDQENTDIRKMEFKAYRGGMGYEGDGWTDKETSSQLDTGRKDTTNYNYAGKS